MAVSVSAQIGSLPDLTIDADRLRASMDLRTRQFRTTDCAVQEGCVSGTGKRLLLRFDVATPNIGTADLVLGNPADRPDLFTYSPCHQHYHLNGYALYELIYYTNSTTVVVVTGRKQAFCLEDFQQYDPGAGPAQFTCSYQGISAGWADVYGKYL
ncbi:MAG: lysyl oxidase family protein, partial [Gammaproteobacteria bacterium]